MGDRETTRRLLAQIGNQFEAAIWRTPQRFKEVQAWAAAENGS
jgi:hypothetical protein